MEVKAEEELEVNTQLLQTFLNDTADSDYKISFEIPQQKVTFWDQFAKEHKLKWQIMSTNDYNIEGIRVGDNNENQNSPKSPTDMDMSAQAQTNQPQADIQPTQMSDNMADVEDEMQEPPLKKQKTSHQ